MGMTLDVMSTATTVEIMGLTCETVHGDPIIYTGWDTDTLNIHCGCGATLELPAGSGLWRILRAYIDHETGE